MVLASGEDLTLNAIIKPADVMETFRENVEKSRKSNWGTSLSRKNEGGVRSSLFNLGSF
jgi:hypothetical protein